MKHYLFIFCISFYLPLKASDITLKVAIAPQSWVLKEHDSLDLRFKATLFNSTDKDAFISLYYFPRMELYNEKVDLVSGIDADLPGEMKSSQMVEIKAHDSFTFVYSATLKQHGNGLRIEGYNEASRSCWSLDASPGRYRLRFKLKSYPISTKYAPELAKLWNGEVSTEPQTIILSRQE